mmetsp:Transcript_47884/g.113791  ORF Transcript_47884/g.113791 Transcript_47884/m.113791 type:complete len:437 (+) Transcript_47884:528-1838(+)
MRAKVLRRQPLIFLGTLLRQTEDGDLRAAVLHGQARVAGVVANLPCRVPLPLLRGCLLHVESLALDVWKVIGGRVSLLALVNVFQLLLVLRLLRVHVLTELLLQGFVVDNLLPLALKGLHVSLHHGLEICADSQHIVDDHLAQVLDSAWELLQPRRGALQMLCRGDVEHEESVNILQACLLIQGGCEEHGVLRFGPTIAGEVQVVTAACGDAPDILAPSFRTLTQAARNRHLDLVRGAQPLVPVLQGHRHADRVLLPIAAPRATNAALHGPQRLAVGMTRLEPGINHLLEYLRQLMHRCSIHSQSLCPCDFGPQPILLRCGSNGNELIWGDVSSSTARNDGVRASLLDIGQESIVGVLDAIAVVANDAVVPKPSHDVGQHWLAELTAFSTHGSLLHCIFKGLDLLDIDNVKELLPSVGEAVADSFLHVFAQHLQGG